MQTAKEASKIDYLLLGHHKDQLLPVCGKISLFTVNKIKQELVAIEEKPRVLQLHCSCPVQTIYNLPCRHVLPRSGPIPMSMIPRRWHLFPDDDGTTLLDIKLKGLLHFLTAVYF